MSSERVIGELSLHLDPSIAAGAELDEYLADIVQASGGKAGILTTWSGDGSGVDHTACCGLEEKVAEALVNLTLRSVREVAGGNTGKAAQLQRSLEEEGQRVGLGQLHALTVPVVVKGRPVGMFCLLHPEAAPEFFKSSPRLYNLVVDHLEVVVNNAKLLQNLMRERLWFETLLTESHDGIAIVDRDSLVVGVNSAMEELTGWKASEVVGQPVHEVFALRSLSTGRAKAPLGGHSAGSSERLGKSGPNAEKRSMGLALYRKASSSTLPISAEPMEADLLDREHQPIAVEVTGLTVRDEAGHPCGWVMSVRDIRRRKETERMGRIFLSAMSHELQTPIAVIKGFAGLLADPEISLPEATVREKASFIYDESERLLRLVRQMLEASSIEAGGISVHFEALDMAELVHRTVRRLEPVAEKQQVKLRVMVKKDLPPAWGDPGRIEQVLTNLVENAIKHGKAGTVVVEVREQDDSIYTCVTDEGPGVSVEDQERIFGLFQRGTEAKVRGSGLGLYISKAIVEAHGGRIGVMRGPKGGACFFFSLPRDLS